MYDKNYNLGIYEKAFPETFDIKEMLQFAEKYGYDFFELSIDRSDVRIKRVFDKEYLSYIIELLSNVNVKIESICLSALSQYTLGNLDEDISKYATEIFKNAIKFAYNAGIRIIQIPACDMPKFENRDERTHIKYCENLRKMIGIASQYGIIIGLENMENEYMNSIKKCMEIINYINSPYLQLYSDSGNIMMANYKDNKYCEDMLYGKGHYVALHLKEAKFGKFGGLFYGEGIVDFKSIVNTSYELGVKRYVFEYWHLKNRDWEYDLNTAKGMFLNWL